MIGIKTLTVGALALGLSLTACGSDSNNNDVCSDLLLCTVEGTTCVGPQIVTCAANADGCLVQTLDQNCAATNQVCDDSGAAPICVDASCDDAACVGASDGDRFCDGDGLVTCNADTDGCLIATTADCTATGQICDDTVGAAGCYDNCSDDTRCTGASEGDTSCDSDTLLTCVTVPGGCLVAEAANCALFGDVCDDSGSPAVCAAGTCNDDALCAGRTDGESWCDGDFLNTCNAGGDGCLDLTQESCGPGTCVDTGTPACTTPATTGEDCANAYVVTNSTTFTNADITAFADDLEFTDSSCQMRTGTSDVVFQVVLLDGETLSVAEYGGADTVVDLQVGTCGEGLACVASQDEPDSGVQTYTATGAETVYIVVEPYSATPTATDVALRIAIDASCGNGLVEPGESCDDGGTTTGDGCSDTCTVEFGWACDGASPTSCTEYQSIGSFAAGDPIADVANTANLPAGYADIFQITFTEDVALSGTLTVPGAGDPDFRLYDSGFNLVISAANVGPEAFSDVVPAGTYLVVVSIYGGDADADQGYVLSMSTKTVADAGTIGDGDSLLFSGGPVAAGTSDFYTVTTSEDVLLTFDLSSDDGATSDMDLYVYSATTGEFITFVADDFDELGRSIALPAGSYRFEFNAYSDASDAGVWFFSATAAAASWTSIGSFAAGATITDTTGGPLAQRDYDHYEITFTEPVLLSGTLGGNTTGEVGVYIYDADQDYVGEFHPGDETITDVALPAGTYVVQILTISETFGGGDVDTYTLSLSTTAP